jgi:PAS domain S-box-containing protein
VACVAAVAGFAALITLGLVHAPTIVMPGVFVIVLAMGYELGWDMIAAAQLATQLRASEQRFRAVVEAVPSAILVVDEKGLISLANQQAEAVFGYPRAELIRQPVELLIPERFHRRSADLAHPVGDRAARAIDSARTRSGRAAQEWRRVSGGGHAGAVADRKRGRSFWRRCWTSPSAVASNRPRPASAMSWPTSRRVAMLGELSGSLAHELNQPLTAILSNAQAAQRFLALSPPRTDKLAEILTDIVKANHRAGSVIVRLRSMLRKEESKCLVLNLNNVVEESLRLLRSDLLARHVTVQSDLAERLPSIEGDRNQLQQVLLNLLMNGCDAMDGPGHRPPPDGAHAADRAGHCRSDRVRSGFGYSRGGSGPRVRSFRDHQGAGPRSGVDHLSLDRGSPWRASLGHQPSAGRRHPALRTARGAGLTKMEERAPTVYLVDDDPDVLTAIGRLIESEGLQVAAFASAQRFLDGFDRRAPGCLVLDLAMPGINGLELQRSLEQEGCLLPIIFLTGRGDIATSVQAMKHGAVDFLTKPVDDTALLAAVHDALAANRAHHRADSERADLAHRLATLTARERQVLEGIAAGMLNKQIAAALGTSEKTIKFHRGNLMRKMGARVAADLVKLAERAGVGSTTAN